MGGSYMKFVELKSGSVSVLVQETDVKTMSNYIDRGFKAAGIRNIEPKNVIDSVRSVKPETNEELKKIKDMLSY